MKTEIRPATQADLAEIRTLLVASALPVADLESSRPDFWVAIQGGSVVGVGGIERFATTGLLRSVAIRPELRGRGLGQALVGRLEADAQEAGLRELVLLTETAEKFFRQLGYSPIDRSQVAAAVRDSAEFRTLCPQSARCLSKRLDDDHV
jgi:amino-acid N-acetyltransferase